MEATVLIAGWSHSPDFCPLHVQVDLGNEDCMRKKTGWWQWTVMIYTETTKGNLREGNADIRILWTCGSFDASNGFRALGSQTKWGPMDCTTNRRLELFGNHHCFKRWEHGTSAYMRVTTKN